MNVKYRQEKQTLYFQLYNWPNHSIILPSLRHKNSQYFQFHGPLKLEPRIRSKQWRAALLFVQLQHLGKNPGENGDWHPAPLSTTLTTVATTQKSLTGLAAATSHHYGSLVWLTLPIHVSSDVVIAVHALSVLCTHNG